jgi:hypothetical protein
MRGVRACHGLRSSSSRQLLPPSAGHRTSASPGTRRDPSLDPRSEPQRAGSQCRIPIPVPPHRGERSRWTFTATAPSPQSTRGVRRRRAAITARDRSTFSCPQGVRDVRPRQQHRSPQGRSARPFDDGRCSDDTHREVASRRLQFHATAAAGARSADQGHRRRRGVAGGIPAVALLREDRPSPLGWQMYVWPSPSLEVVVLDADGGPLDREASDHTARYRLEVPYHRHLPPHVREVEPEAHAVVLRGGSGNERRTPKLSSSSALRSVPSRPHRPGTARDSCALDRVREPSCVPRPHLPRGCSTSRVPVLRWRPPRSCNWFWPCGSVGPRSSSPGCSPGPRH